MYVLIIGSPIDGFHHIGPFSSREEAEKYGEEHFSSTEWWIMDLVPPNNIC
jgi:hypothetical protein